MNLMIMNRIYNSEELLEKVLAEIKTLQYIFNTNTQLLLFNLI